MYSSTTIALACLETVVHGAGLPVRRWLASRSTLLATVPSVIVPEERNVLIHPGHPGHPACSSLVAQVVREWSYDNRLLAPPRAASD